MSYTHFSAAQSVRPRARACVIQSLVDTSSGGFINHVLINLSFLSRTRPGLGPKATPSRSAYTTRHAVTSPRQSYSRRQRSLAEEGVRIAGSLERGRVRPRLSNCTIPTTLTLEDRYRRK